MDTLALVFILFLLVYTLVLFSFFVFFFVLNHNWAFKRKVITKTIHKDIPWHCILSSSNSLLVFLFSHQSTTFGMRWFTFIWKPLGNHELYSLSPSRTLNPFTMFLSGDMQNSKPRFIFFSFLFDTRKDFSKLSFSDERIVIMLLRS